MLNINETLNNLIAVVVVLLTLSLVVQSVQSVLKKAFKIKSRQIEESLVDLLRNLINRPHVRPTSLLERLVDHSPVLRFVFRWYTDKAHRAGVAVIYQNIMAGFADVGRLAQSGNQMLDSIAKEDLLKVFQKIPIASVLPNFGAGVETAFERIKTLERGLENLRGALSAAASQFSAEYASIEVKLRPLFNDVQSIIDAQKVPLPGIPPPAGAAPDLLIRDIAALREVNVDEVLKMLSELQKKVTEASAVAGIPAPSAVALRSLATSLGNTASAIAGLRQQLDAAIAPFKAKVAEVGDWYDITMQSFEERYNRSMKSWAIVIAFLIVVVLNANFFNVYRSIASSGVVSNLLVEKAPEILKASKERTASAQTPTTTPTTTPATTPATTQERRELSPEEEKAEKEKAEKAERAKAQKELREAVELVKGDASTYLGMGFAPLQWEQVKHWLRGLIPDGKTEYPWGNWWQARKHDARGLLGWIIMTMLLSIGAPFWQDTLESLFGVKNLLRKKGDIKNVETESGAGQPKP